MPEHALPVVADLAAAKTAGRVELAEEPRIGREAIGIPAIAAVHTCVEARPCICNIDWLVFVAARRRGTVHISRVCRESPEGQRAYKRQPKNTITKFHT